MNLDGTDKIKATPFDAHEQVVRGSHTHSQANGYESSEYRSQQYPKAVAHDEETGEPIIALNARHEQELLKGRTKEEKN